MEIAEARMAAGRTPLFWMGFVIRVICAGLQPVVSMIRHVRRRVAFSLRKRKSIPLKGYWRKCNGIEKKVIVNESIAVES